MTPPDKTQSNQWKAAKDTEYIKLLIADIRRVIDGILTRALHHDPLNPDAALDDIYRLAKEGERDLDTLYGIFLEEWISAVKAARRGAEFEGEEAADIERMRNIVKTKEMGRSTRRRTKTGNWQERWKRTPR